MRIYSFYLPQNYISQISTFKNTIIMEKKITVIGVLTEGISIGIKNVVPLLVSCLLYAVTIWIPYINVGTTIAMSTIPLELSRGKVINPLFIFDAKYRKFMGEYMILIALMSMAIITAMFFFFIPALVINTAWSLAVLLLLDKGISPLEAIMESNKATYGYKWTIFGINFAVAVLGLILVSIFMMIPFLGVLLVFATSIAISAISLSCTAVVYRNLTQPQPTTTSTTVIAE